MHTRACAFAIIGLAGGGSTGMGGDTPANRQTDRACMCMHVGVCMARVRACVRACLRACMFCMCEDL